PHPPPASPDPPMEQPPPDSLPSVPTRSGWASLKDLNGYHWFVFIVCCLAWDMDCMDQQLFTLARRPAMVDLVPRATAEDPRVPEHTRKMAEQSAAEGKPAPKPQQVLASLQNADVGAAAGWATSWFLVGWSIGGSGLGILG